MKDYKLPDILPEKRELVRGRERWEHVFCYPLISKEQLAYHYDCVNTKALRKKIFTDEDLQALGWTIEEHNRHRGQFSSTKTVHIYEHFLIRWLKVW